MPTLSCVMKTPNKLAKNSGAEPPAAINVAPATSSDIDSCNDQGIEISGTDRNIL